tara:strand:- start:218 stop:1264 length:1047 start_codon:yes stop_codon:yes gene_type:complete
MTKIEKFSFSGTNRSNIEAHNIFIQRIKDSHKIYDKFHSDFIERSCPICGSSNNILVEPFIEKFSISRCNHCLSYFSNPCPSNKSLNYYYNKCKCNTELGKLLGSWKRKKSKIISDRTLEVLKIIKEKLKLKKFISILEVGCHSGAFLSELENELINLGILDNVKIDGIDIDSEAIKNNQTKKSNLKNISAEELSSYNKKYDLIMHFELIEHLPDPFKFMLSTKNLLDSDGVTYFHTPNAMGFDNQALWYNDFRPLAHGIFPPMHLQAFTTHNIILFLDRCGFSLNELKTPGKFDVDMINNYSKEINKHKSVFKLIKNFNEDQRNIIQLWLQKLKCSSHMTIKASHKI